MISFSGIDCGGKSTQIDKVAQAFKEEGRRYKIIHSRVGYTPLLELVKTAIRKDNYKKTDIYEGQVMITRDNIDSIQEFQVEGRALRQAIIEKYMEANPSKWDFLSDCKNLIPQTEKIHY